MNTQRHLKLSGRAKFTAALGLIVFSVLSTLTVYDTAITYGQIAESNWFVIILIFLLSLVIGLIGEYAFISIYWGIKRLEISQQETKTELKEEIKEVNTELKEEIKEEIKEVKTELKGDIKEVKTELKGDIKEVKTELKGGMKEVKTELKEDMHRDTVKILTVLGRMMKRDSVEEERALYSQKASPLNMTGIGAATLESSGLAEYVDDHREEWDRDLSKLNPEQGEHSDLYQIAEAIYAFVERNISATEETKEIIKAVGTVQSVHLLAGLYLRNQFFKENNWDINDIDKYEPKPEGKSKRK